MIVIDLPAEPAAAKIGWRLRQPSQSNRSEFTGVRRTTILPLAPRWKAKVTYPTIIGEAAVQPWRAALAKLDGTANAFRLVACERPQHSMRLQVVADGAGQTGFALKTRGWLRGGRLRAGMFVTIADQLLQVAETAIAGDDGRMTIAVKPYLAAPTLDGAAVETREPYAVVSMTSDEAGWDAEEGETYKIEFECEEAR